MNLIACFEIDRLSAGETSFCELEYSGFGLTNDSNFESCIGTSKQMTKMSLLQWQFQPLTRVARLGDMTFSATDKPMERKAYIASDVLLAMNTLRLYILDISQSSRNAEDIESRLSVRR